MSSLFTSFLSPDLKARLGLSNSAGSPGRRSTRSAPRPLSPGGRRPREETAAGSSASPRRLSANLQTEVRSPGLTSRLTSIIRDQDNQDNPRYSHVGNLPVVNMKKRSQPLLTNKNSKKFGPITGKNLVKLRIAPPEPFSPFKSRYGSVDPLCGPRSPDPGDRSTDPRSVIAALAELSGKRVRRPSNDPSETGSKRARRDSSSSLGSSLSMEMPPLFSNGVVGQTTSHLVSREADLSLGSLLSRNQSLFGGGGGGGGGPPVHQPSQAVVHSPSVSSPAAQTSSGGSKHRSVRSEIIASLSSSRCLLRKRGRSESDSDDSESEDTLRSKKRSNLFRSPDHGVSSRRSSRRKSSVESNSSDTSNTSNSVDKTKTDKSSSPVGESINLPTISEVLGNSAKKKNSNKGSPTITVKDIEADRELNEKRLKSMLTAFDEDPLGEKKSGKEAEKPDGSEAVKLSQPTSETEPAKKPAAETAGQKNTAADTPNKALTVTFSVETSEKENKKDEANKSETTTSGGGFSFKLGQTTTDGAQPPNTPTSEPQQLKAGGFAFDVSRFNKESEKSSSVDSGQKAAEPGKPEGGKSTSDLPKPTFAFGAAPADVTVSKTITLVSPTSSVPKSDSPSVSFKLPPTESQAATSTSSAALLPSGGGTAGTTTTTTSSGFSFGSITSPTVSSKSATTAEPTKLFSFGGEAATAAGSTGQLAAGVFSFGGGKTSEPKKAAEATPASTAGVFTFGQVAATAASSTELPFSLTAAAATTDSAPKTTGSASFTFNPISKPAGEAPSFSLTKPAGSSAAPSFNFGAATATSTTKPGGGTEATAAAPSFSFSAAAAKTTAGPTFGAVAPSVFSFGGSTAASSSSSTGAATTTAAAAAAPFAFGGATNTTVAQPAAAGGVFQFGQASKPSGTAAGGAGGGVFQFGGGAAAQKPAATNASFTFGGSAAPSATTTAAAVASPFKFSGATATTTAASNNASFQFGKPSDSTPSFSFGGGASAQPSSFGGFGGAAAGAAPAQTASPFGAPAATTSAKPAQGGSLFDFGKTGGNNSAAASSPFSFGGQPQQISSGNSANPSPFQFGGGSGNNNNAAAKAAGTPSFSFAGGSTGLQQQQPAPSTTKPSASFQFGQASGGSSVFQFGGGSQPAPAAAPAPSFGFGGAAQQPPQQQSSSVFQFGGAQQASNAASPPNPFSPPTANPPSFGAAAAAAAPSFGAASSPFGAPAGAPPAGGGAMFTVGSGASTPRNPTQRRYATARRTRK